MRIVVSADIYGLTVEHWQYSHPVLSVLLSKFFLLITLCRSIPSGFKRSYIVLIPKVQDCRTKAMSCDDLGALPSALFCQKCLNIVCLNNCSHLLNLMIISLALRKRLAAHMQFILHVISLIVGCRWGILQIFAQLISPKPLIKSIILLFISSL